MYGRTSSVHCRAQNITKQTEKTHKYPKLATSEELKFPSDLHYKLCSHVKMLHKSDSMYARKLDSTDIYICFVKYVKLAMYKYRSVRICKLQMELLRVQSKYIHKLLNL
jgi:hypothetical protein